MCGPDLLIVIMVAWQILCTRISAVALWWRRPREPAARTPTHPSPQTIQSIIKHIHGQCRNQTLCGRVILIVLLVACPIWLPGSSTWVWWSPRGRQPAARTPISVQKPPRGFSDNYRTIVHMQQMLNDSCLLGSSAYLQVTAILRTSCCDVFWSAGKTVGTHAIG